MKQLVKINNDTVVFRQDNKIIVEPINKQAKQMLDWYSKNIPANN